MRLLAQYRLARRFLDRRHRHGDAGPGPRRFCDLSTSASYQPLRRMVPSRGVMATWIG